jgi:hypothetical protein
VSINRTVITAVARVVTVIGPVTIITIRSNLYLNIDISSRMLLGTGPMGYAVISVFYTISNNFLPA